MPASKAQLIKLKKLGLKLKELRMAKGLTLNELGFRIDKEPQSISRVEMGEINPTYLYLLLLCEGLEVDLGDVLKNI